MNSGLCHIMKSTEKCSVTYKSTWGWADWQCCHQCIWQMIKRVFRKSFMQIVIPNILWVSPLWFWRLQLYKYMRFFLSRWNYAQLALHLLVEGTVLNLKSFWRYDFFNFHWFFYSKWTVWTLSTTKALLFSLVAPAMMGRNASNPVFLHGEGTTYIALL